MSRLLIHMAIRLIKQLKKTQLHVGKTYLFPLLILLIRNVKLLFLRHLIFSKKSSIFQLPLSY